MMNDRAKYMFETIKYVSASINEYFEDRRYLIGVEEPESISDNELLNIAIDQLLNELEAMGIETNLEIDDLLTYGPYFDIMISLRKKFDSINFTNELQLLDKATFGDYTAILNDQQNCNDFYIETIDFFSQLFKLDLDWQRLTNSYERFTANNGFVTYILNIVNKVIEDNNNRVYISEDNISSVVEFTQDMAKRDQIIENLSNFVLTKIPNLSETELRYLKTRYDKDKLGNEVLPLFAAYFKMNPKPTKEPIFVVNHHRNNNHHLEYWQAEENKDKTITPEIVCMIIFSMILDGDDKNVRQDKLTKFYPYMSEQVKYIANQINELDYSEVYDEVK